MMPNHSATSMSSAKGEKSDQPLLSVRNLEVTFESGDRRAQALRGLDLEIQRGTIHALVGESGSGKSVFARSILGLLPKDRVKLRADSVTFDGREILDLDERALRDIRGSRISMIFQEPAKHLNPAIKIGRQIGEVIQVHLGVSAEEAFYRANKMLELVGLAEGVLGSRRILQSYPHELSGGMKQRAMIAMALSCDPDLLIADEPTTALDVTIQKQIIDLIRNINDQLGMTVLFISHDLTVVHEVSDVVSVIYAGKVVEHAPSNDVFHHPVHPYAKLLLASVPDPDKRGERLCAIPGRVPDAEHVPAGCAFHPRCPHAYTRCSQDVPDMRSYAIDDRAGEVACHMIFRDDTSSNTRTSNHE